MALKWNEGQMAAALDEVRMGHISQYSASKKYGIPWQTLSDRFLGKCSTKVGDPQGCLKRKRKK